MDKRIIKHLSLALILLVILATTVICLFNHNKKIKDLTLTYLKDNYPMESFEYVSLKYHLDGSIHQVTYKDTDSQIHFKVFERRGMVYDNYVRSHMETKMKALLYETLESKLKYKDLSLFLSRPFEHDSHLKKESYMDHDYYVAIEDKKIFDKELFINKYSIIARDIFCKFSNIESIVVKNYEMKDKEIYFSIDRDMLKFDYSIENIQLYLQGLQMVHEI